MTGIGSTASMRPSNTVSHATRANPRPQPSSDDVHAMRGAFAKADGRLPLAQERGRKADAKLANGKLKTDQRAGDEAERAEGARGRAHDHGRLDTDQDADQDNQQGLFATAQQAVIPIAAPDMPGPHVDPSAFAQLMTQLWLREKGKGAREVRVSFGEDAWPATGARLVRNAGGALDIQLHVADGGAAFGEDTLGGLQSQLASHGLAVGALQLETGALA